MARFQSVDDESRIERILFDELGTKPRELFDRVRGIDCGCALLRFLDANANSLITVDDIAYHLVETSVMVERGIYALLDLGLVRCVDVEGLVFFGITADSEQRQNVRELCDWQDRWHARLLKIERMVSGKEELQTPKRILESQAG